jgi:hypothetical protein
MYTRSKTRGHEITECPVPWPCSRPFRWLKQPIFRSDACWKPRHREAARKSSGRHPRGLSKAAGYTPFSLRWRWWIPPIPVSRSAESAWIWHRQDWKGVVYAGAEQTLGKHFGQTPPLNGRGSDSAVAPISCGAVTCNSQRSPTRKGGVASWHAISRSRHYTSRRAGVDFL